MAAFFYGRDAVFGGDGAGLAGQHMQNSLDRLRNISYSAANILKPRTSMPGPMLEPLLTMFHSMRLIAVYL